MSDFAWGTVTALSPLRVKLDGDTAALPVTPDSLVDPLLLSVNDRVQIELQNNHVIVFGVAGGPHLTLSSLIQAAALAKNRIRNAAFRLNQRGYVSGTALGVGAYAHDGWKDARVVNLDTDPRQEAAALNWTALLGSGAGAATGTKVTTRSHSATGTKCLSLTASSTGDAYVKRDYTVVPGKSYTFAIWAWVTATGTFFTTGRALAVIDQGNTVLLAQASIDQTKLNQWQRLTVTVIPTTTTLTMRVYPYLSNTSAIFYDDVLVTEGTVLWPDFCGADTGCTWSSTADASASTLGPTTAASLTFTADPHGQQVTLNTSAQVQQIIERTHLDAGTYVLAWSGTATARVYNSNTPIASRPAFAASGLTVVLDGTADVVVEFSAGTIGKVRLFLGTLDYGFTLGTVGDELRECQRYFYPLVVGDLRIVNDYWNVALGGGSQTVVAGHPLVELHHPPFVSTPAGGVVVIFIELATAGGGANYNLRLGAWTGSSTRILLASYTSTDNAGATITSGRFRGFNSATAAWIDADLR